MPNDFENMKPPSRWRNKGFWKPKVATSRRKPAERVKREPDKWRLIPHQLTCEAMTKSEARAKFKEMVNATGRLPIEDRVIKQAKA